MIVTQPKLPEDGNETGLLFEYNPVSMLKDPLTGVYSRAILEQRLHEEIERAERYHDSFSLILLDLDYYKSINDAFGHRRGDQVLVEFARRLNSLVRKSDIVFRYGGDEFLLLLPKTPRAQAIQLGQRLLDGVRSHPFRGKPPIFLSISMGIASFPTDACTPEALFEKSDQRHYEAKRLGRGRAVWEDSVSTSELLIDEDIRLVERDTALDILHRFLKELPANGTGLFVVTGPAGSGRSRYLSEVGKVARLQGYEVIGLHGDRSTKNRLFGDLSEIIKTWESLPHPSIGKEAFGKALCKLVEDKGRKGIFITVDNLPETDWATQDLLRYLLAPGSLPLLIGLAYSTGPEAARSAFAPAAQLVESVELSAFSRQGFEVWLRSTLHWEAPVEFSDWFYHQTNGLPAVLKRGLLHLVKQGVLQKNGQQWQIIPHYNTIPLQAQLGSQGSQSPNNLPAAPTSFVGREQEIQDAKRLLENNRLLTLIGPGGVGKTRLALQVASELLDNYFQRVYWVPLEAVASPDLLADTLMDVLQCSIFGQSDAKTQLISYLKEKNYLLVLDNFEHLIPEAPFLANILENAPQVRFLVTSRERLNLRGEAVLEVRGMGYPEPASFEQVEAYPAVQLFIQSARRAYPEFELAEGSKTDVVRICQMMDGLPLGIELAAAWVRLLSCKEISAEIEQNLDFLTTPLKDVPTRHRSIRAVFEHSWGLLTEDERNVLKRVSVFDGGFEREAAYQAAGASLNALSILVDKTLLRRTVSGRFEMHEILHKYASEFLLNSPEEFETTRTAHCLYYGEFCARENHRLYSANLTESINVISIEMTNLCAAWDWAVTHQIIPVITQMLPCLFNYHWIRGSYQVGEQILSAAGSTLENAGCQDRVILSSIRARQGAYHYLLTRYKSARTLLEDSLCTFQEADLPTELAFTQMMLGKLEVELGDYPSASKCFKESLEIYRRTSEIEAGQVLIEIGNIEYQYGNFQNAKGFFQESESLFRSFNYPWGLARSLNNRGNVEIELGEHRDALQCYQECLDLCIGIGARNLMASALNNLGDTARVLGQYQEAKAYLSHSLELYEEVGDRYGVGVALNNLGNLAYLQGDYTEADQLLRRSLKIANETGNRLEASYVLVQLGRVSCALGNLPQAHQEFRVGLELGKSSGTIPLVMEALLGIASLYEKSGDIERAYELIVAILNHPSTMKEQQEESQALRLRLESHLSPAQVQSVNARGRERPMEDILTEILKERE